MAPSPFKRFILSGLKNDKIIQYVSQMFKDRARHSLEQMKTPKGEKSGTLVLETTAPLNMILGWYSSIRDDSKSGGMIEGTTLDVLPYDSPMTNGTDPDLDDQIKSLLEERDQLAGEVSQLEGQLALRTSELTRQQETGRYYLDEQVATQAKLDRATQKIGELARAKQSLDTRYAELESTSQQLLDSNTQAITEAKAERETNKTLQERVTRLDAELRLAQLSIRKPRTPEALIKDYIASQRSHYEQAAQTLASVPQTFDPTVSVDKLVADELERQGIAPDARRDEPVPPPPFEETAAFREGQPAFLEAEKYLALLEMHLKGEISLPTALADQLQREKRQHETTVQAFMETQESHNMEVERYTRQQEARTRIESIRNRIETEIVEQREAGFHALESLIQKIPPDELQIPLFIQQVELSNVFLLGILLPIGKEMLESTEPSRVYFHNMLAQIALGNTVMLNAENIDMETVKEEGYVGYQVFLPKGEDGWNRKKAAAFRTRLIDSMIFESGTFPLFKSGYRLNPIYIETGSRTHSENDEDPLERESSRVFQQYIVADLRKREHLLGRSIKLRICEIDDALHANPEIHKDLATSGEPAMERGKFSWKVTNALYSLVQHRRVMKEREGRNSLYFLNPAAEQE